MFLQRRKSAVPALYAAAVVIGIYSQPAVQDVYDL